MRPNVTPPGGISAPRPGYANQGVPPVPPVTNPGAGHDPFWDSMRRQDLASLDLLAVFHRIVAGFLALIALFAAPPALLFGRLREMNGASGLTEGTSLIDAYFGIFGGFALAVVIAHVLGAILFWVAGGWLVRRRCYPALLAIQVFSLLLIPHGTALGIFGLIILLKPHVREAFA